MKDPVYNMIYDNSIKVYKILEDDSLILVSKNAGTTETVIRKNSIKDPAVILVMTDIVKPIECPSHLVFDKWFVHMQIFESKTNGNIS